MTKEVIGRARGGKKTASLLTKEQKKEKATKAAESRWNPEIMKATHGGALKVGSVNLPCYVIKDGIRVLSLSGINRAFGGSMGGVKKEEKIGVRNLPRILAASSVKPFISQELLACIESHYEFRPPQGGRTAYGYEATLLPMICETILDAAKAGAFDKRPETPKIAELLLRGFARVGIIALVDEATGYEKDKKKDDLAKILEAFIAKELQPWIPTFDSEFYEEIFRLRGLNYPTDTVKRPLYFGHITNDIVYKRLAPGVLQELKKVTAKDSVGRNKHKLFQLLTKNKGYPKLKQHLGSVITMMKLSDNWQQFTHNLNRIHPAYNQTIELPFQYNAEDDSGRGL